MMTKTTLARFSISNIMAHVSGEVDRIVCENEELRRWLEEVVAERDALLREWQEGQDLRKEETG